MPKLTILVGPPGSGKSTLARKMANDSPGLAYVNQDSQGKDGHQEIFKEAIYAARDIIVDRMGFNKQQREKYLMEAKTKGYETEIIVLHQPYAVCLDRVLKRIGNHETIVDEKGARSALQLFFTKYERPQEGEADKITFVYPDGPKPLAIYSDLDGTLCDVLHRRHHVRPPEGTGACNSGTFDPTTMTLTIKPFKKNWAAFFKEIPNDPVNKPVLEVLKKFSDEYRIVFCSGRSTNEKKSTVEWLDKHVTFPYDLHMRDRSDSRMDATVKEILLDFEILTRYDILFCLDDRDQVVKMLRGRGLTVFQVADGDF